MYDGIVYRFTIEVNSSWNMQTRMGVDSHKKVRAIISSESGDTNEICAC